MKSFNDTEQANLVIEKRIPKRGVAKSCPRCSSIGDVFACDDPKCPMPACRRMVTALPKRQHQAAMAAHAAMMSMIAAGFHYDVTMRAWVKRGEQVP